MPTDSQHIFTDDDLRRLKYQLDYDQPILTYPRLNDLLKGLVARLDSAERCAGYLGSLAVLDTTMEVLLKEWRTFSSRE